MPDMWRICHDVYADTCPSSFPWKKCSYFYINIYLFEQQNYICYGSRIIVKVQRIFLFCQYSVLITYAVIWKLSLLCPLPAASCLLMNSSAVHNLQKSLFINNLCNQYSSTYTDSSLFQSTMYTGSLGSCICSGGQGKDIASTWINWKHNSRHNFSKALNHS